MSVIAYLSILLDFSTTRSDICDNRDIPRCLWIDLACDVVELVPERGSLSYRLR